MIDKKDWEKVKEQSSGYLKEAEMMMTIHSALKELAEAKLKEFPTDVPNGVG